MFEDLLNLFRHSRGLLTEATDDALSMLDQGKEMFTIVSHAMIAEVDTGVQEKIRTLDRELNQIQKSVRRRVFEHLVISRGEDILQSLVLVTIVVDLERIGDYTKNMAELIEMMPGNLDLGERGSLIDELRASTSELFDLTRAAYKEDKADKAEQAIAVYDSVSKRCDTALRDDIFARANEEPMVSKSVLAQVLVLRYIKRICAHLKNMATTVVNPIDRIGFRPKSS